MNVDCRRWWGTSAVTGRILATGLVLLGAGCAVLESGSRLHVPIDAKAKSAASSSGAIVPDANNGASSHALSLLAGMPLAFEPNQGQGSLDQTDPRAKFVARGSGYSLFLGSEGAIVSLASRNQAKSSSAVHNTRRGTSPVDSIQMKLVGANLNSGPKASDLLPGKSNYFIGNNPSKWRSEVPHFARVRYDDVYPGINLVFYGDQGRLEYDLQVEPGSDPAKAEIEFQGAKSLELKRGNLVIGLEGGSIQLLAPQVYQDIAGNRQAVESSFVLRGANKAGFALGSYDHSRELIIDPILTFSTFFGGIGDEHSTSVAVDGSFNVYLAGSTTSADLPAVGVLQTTPGGGVPNVYVAKITPPLGSLPAVLKYVTYLGGDGSDTPVGIKVDGAGDPFVAGTTSSTDFPTTFSNAYQASPATPGTNHVFVTRLNNTAASLFYSSYLSGNGADIASGMTIDASGHLFVTGTTTSVESAGSDQFPATNLPQTQPYQSSSRAPGMAQFFVTKVDTNSSKNGSIAYSTYFGGGTFDTPTPVATGGGIAVDGGNNVYFTGTTNFRYTGCSGCGTSDFPILNAYQPCLDQAPPTTVVNPPTCSASAATAAADAFVAKLNPNVSPGQQLVWSTYLGGTGTDSAAGVALDHGAANVFVVGTTDSADIATSITSVSSSAAYQRCLDTPVNPAAGTACTPPGTPYASDAFVARLNNPTSASGTSANVTLNYFSYLGGSANDSGSAIDVDLASGALVTGWTQSGDFPILPAANSIQSSLKGTQDAFVARLNTAAVVGQTTTASWASYFGGSGIDSGTGITLDPNQNTYLAGETNSGDLQVAKPLTGADGGGYKGGYDAFVIQLGTALSLSIQGALTQETSQQSFVSAGNPATFTYTVTNNGPDLANNISVTANLNSTLTQVPFTSITPSVTAGSCGAVSANSSVSCTLPSLQSGSTATVTIIATPTANSDGNPETFNGGTVEAIASGNIVLAQTSVAATMSDFSMSVSPTNQSISQAGKPATFQVLLTPRPLYTSNINVSCTGLPSGASCAFAPTNPIKLLSTGAGSVTLTISTTARPVPPPSASLFKRSFYAFWFAVPGLSLLFVGMRGSRRRRRIAGFLMLGSLCSMLLLVPACSHSSTQQPVSGTPSGDYTITVAASSGTDTKSQTVTLHVP